MSFKFYDRQPSTIPDRDAEPVLIKNNTSFTVSLLTTYDNGLEVADNNRS